MKRLALLAALLSVPAFAATPPSFSVDNVSVDEAAGVANVRVRKHGSATNKPSTVVFSTVDGTARAGGDYQAKGVTLTFAPAQTSAVVAVALVDDAMPEASESFTARISAGSNARLYDGTAVVTITDADSAVPDPVGLPDIADNFDASAWLEPGEAPHVSPDEVGAFRFTCLAGHLAYDDPIVYPGQPGKSHLHQFFGNTATDGNSTYESLRTTGGSTCTRSEGVSPQRSAYWMPAMLDGAGNVVKPDWINTYYKQLPASDPECAKLQDPNTRVVISSGGRCVHLPGGIRFLIGYNMTTGDNDFTDPNSREYWAMSYNCVRPDTLEETVVKKHNIPEVLAAGCPSGAWLRVSAAFPQCWDGKNVDSPDHRSHIAFPVQMYCPPSHPYKFPEVTVAVHFRTDANFLAGKWHLSADHMFPERPAGSALHFDYWEAWSPTLKGLWQKNCIDGHLSCSTGNVGDGRQIKGMAQVGPYPVHVTEPL